MSRPTIRDRRARFGGIEHRLNGLVRRAVLGVAASLQRWQLSASEDEPPFTDVPVYQQAGFASFPAAGEAVKAILLALGGTARNFVAVASSSSAGRPAMVAGETATFNSQGAHVIYKANGDIVVRCKPGQQVLIDDGSGAVPLATKADLEALKSAISGAAVVANDGGAALQANILAALTSWPVGTTVLKGK